MPTLSVTEHDMARTYAAEFAQIGLAAPVTDVTCIYRSHAFPDTRLVMKVETSSRNYAMKIDTLSPETGRLEKEFDILVQVFEHFHGNRTSRVVRPIFLSPGGAFLVTEFSDRPTAVDLIYNSNDDDQVAQVYRRAGSWLHDLHGFHRPTSYKFRPRWMTDNIREQAKFIPSHVAPDCQPMVDSFLDEAANLKNRPDLRVFSHGDFHGLNLILGQGTAIGLDFTEARDKLAVYDIVDFLKADIFRDGPNSEIDRSGILKRNKGMFFRRYRHPVDTDILDCCIRGRLLKDWLHLWQPDRICSDFDKRRRARLEIRLKQAFG